MQEWSTISYLLCVFGFVREIRPSESYIMEFMFGEWHNFTQEQVYREIVPFGTYSYLGQLVIVFLITDLFRYKSLIIAMGAAGVIIWSMLLWTTSMAAMKTVQFVYGFYMAADVAYYTYIYAKVDKRHYPLVTSHTRAAIFLGKLVGGLIAQLLVYFEWMDYKELNYISLGTQIFAMLWAFGLPKVEQSLYFHRDLDDRIEKRKLKNRRKDFYNNTKSAFQLLWQHFHNAYTNLRVAQWSLWYATSLCGYIQVIFYVQVLWLDIKPKQTVSWNGAVDSLYTSLGALSALAAGYMFGERLKPKSSLLLLATLSALQGGCLLLCCWTNELIVSFVGYVLFGTFYAFGITIVSTEIANNLEEDSFGMVFGFNTFVALVLETLLTLAVVSDYGLALTIVGQYAAYGYCFIVVSIIYLIFVIVECYFVHECHTEDNDINEYKAEC